MTSRARTLTPSIAPWAEIVPGMGPVAVDLLLTLPDDSYVYEVVDGVLVRMAGSGAEATTIGLRLAARLLAYVEEHRLGRVTGADGVYKFSNAETGLIPDAGFYAAERRALVTDRSKPIPFAPDLAVEVASPSQRANEMAAKAGLYLSGGTRLVWVIWPQSQHIDVWRVGKPDSPSRALAADDSFDGEDVVPGFTYAVAALFADPLDA